MFPKDASGGLSVNEGLPDDDLDEEGGTWQVIDVPVSMPHLDLAKASESERGQDALDDLDVDLGSTILSIDVGGAEEPEVLQGELTMEEGEVSQLL